jgi:hypothetical protein
MDSTGKTQGIKFRIKPPANAIKSTNPSDRFCCFAEGTVKSGSNGMRTLPVSRPTTHEPTAKSAGFSDPIEGNQDTVIQRLNTLHQAERFPGSLGHHVFHVQFCQSRDPNRLSASKIHSRWESVGTAARAASIFWTHGVLRISRSEPTTGSERLTTWLSGIQISRQTSHRASPVNDH